MAQQKRTNRTQPPAQRTRSQTPAQRSQPPAQRRRTPAKKKQSFSLVQFLPKAAEFKPDAEGSSLLKLLHMTRLQRLSYLKWILYIAVMILMLVIQDVVMSRVTLFGGTTDLAVCVILLITVIEGTEVGSIFVLLASAFYYFSGSSPGPACVMLLTFAGIGACMFRQMYLHRSRGSIVLCAGLALMLYEIGIYGTALFLELTRWNRINVFLVTGLLSWIVMIPLYSLINRIGQIGGNTWKE
ncbi:MAG: hypothetical protein IJ001_00010 [Oscillospiraceae bacterium]|nr:hypothetical protein [Oscillospiraceae bacterium]